MKWKNNSLYKSKTKFNPELFSLRNLIYNYQPLIGSDAITLYLFLYSESTNGITSSLFLSHERVLKITNLIKEEILLAISKLELFSLLEVYFEKETNRVIYILQAPLDFDNLEEDFLSLYLVKKIGVENAKINESFLSNKTTSEVLTKYEKLSINQPILKNPALKITKERIKLNINFELSILLNLFDEHDLKYRS